MGTAIKRRSAADMLQDELGRETPEAGSDYLRSTVSSIMSSSLPEFDSRLQDIRENAIRRGISTGDLGTSYEGDLASAFQRNITNEVGARSYDMYQTSRNRYLDLLTGQRDYDTAQANAKKKRRGGILGAVGGIAGAAVGSLVPGVGTYLGASLGSGLGNAAGNL